MSEIFALLVIILSSLNNTPEIIADGAYHIDTPEVKVIAPEPAPEPVPYIAPQVKEPVVIYFEDGSWRNTLTNETGCDTGADCDLGIDPIRHFEDGSWVNTLTGETGCGKGGLCED